MPRYKVNDDVSVWSCHDSPRGAWVSIQVVTSVGMVDKWISPLEARNMANWILANVPDEPERDREADMEKLAKEVIQRLAYTNANYGTNIAIYGDNKGICLDFVLQVIGMDFDVPGEFHDKHSDKHYEYAKSLWDDLIPWMQKRYGGA